MRTTLALSLAASLGFVAPQQPARDRPAAPPVQGTASISGRVTVMDSKPVLPVRRAKVTLTSGALSQPRTTDTDTAGRYQFSQLPPGSYRVTVDKPAYVSLPFGATRWTDRPAPIELNTAGVTADVALPRGAAVEGRLVNEDGEPVQNIIVSAIRFEYGPAGRRAVVVRQTRTDDLGRYRVHSLPAGEFYVDAAPDPLQPFTELSAPGARPPRSARTYLPGTPRVQDARRLALATGQDLQGLDFPLTTVPVAQVSGQVLNALGAPAAVRGIRMQEVGAPPGDVRGTLQGNRFMFPSVPPGDYWLMAVIPGGSGADPEFAATRVTIAGQDVSGMTIATVKGAVLEGTLECEEGSAVPPGLRLAALETEFEVPGGGQPAPGAETPVGAGGRVAVNGLFGPRVLRVAGLPSGWALKGIWLDGAEISDAVVDFRGGSAPRPLRVVITDKTGSLSGTVVNARRRPAVNSTVVVFSDDERQWGATSRFVKTVAVAGDGHFSVEGLLPGKYLVAAVDVLEEGAWNDPDVLRRLRAGAASVSLTESDAQTVSLKVRGT